MEDPWMFYFDPNRCIGCHACSIACKQRHDRDPDADDWRTVTHLSRGEYPEFEQLPVSMSCMHCHDAPCETVCPPNAITKREEDGIVTVDRDRCIGCHYCAWACPFGAPTYGDEGLMSKCNMCLGQGPGSGHDQPPKERPEDGGLQPACESSCVGDAIKAGPRSEVLDHASEKAAVRFENDAYGGRVVVEPVDEDAELAAAVRENNTDQAADWLNG